ncbi:RES domain-containing protein [Nocardioides sp. 616]|uniref:RES domain-containing protein n=1 Tax=Nocardioides sp. 616 TaxID=2268090 RepID=UPI000CE38F54|nr:RES domain-containing protein [Nocardioides sp. 616]
MSRSNHRNSLALRAPDETALDFTRFPRRTLRADGEWYRQHRDRPTPDRGAWHFASYAPGDEGEGRFDLPNPDGTCYLASTETGAVNELVGPDCADRGWVDSDLVADRLLSRLRLPVDVKAADTTSARASEFRATNELPVTERYDLTQAWADTLHRAGFGGVYTVLRFTLGATRGLALFGISGAPDPSWPGDASPRPVRDVVESLGIGVEDPPAYGTVTIVSP